MTLQQAIDKARRLARVDDTGKLDSEVMDCVNEAMKAFVKRVHDVTKVAYLDVVPIFNINTNMAIRVEITGGTNALTATDVIITATTVNGISGTTLAGYLQTQIRAAIGGGANLTVTWSSTAWTFTVDTIDGTEITISAPTTIIYANACDMLGLSGTESGTAVTLTGNIPEDCTVDVDLPSDFLALVGAPEWDGDPLMQTPLDTFASPEIFGEPTRFFVFNGKMKLSPTPNKQGNLKILYRYFPTEFLRVSARQGLGKTVATPLINTTLSASTQYYFKIRVDDGDLTEYDITTGPDTPVYCLNLESLLNAEMLAQDAGCEWFLDGGDLYCQSLFEGPLSNIELAIGTTGTDLFGSLPGGVTFADVETPQYTTDIPLDDNYCMAIVHHVAGQLLEESFEVQLSLHHYGQFEKHCSDYIVDRANENTSIFPRHTWMNQWEVDPS